MQKEKNAKAENKDTDAHSGHRLRLMGKLDDGSLCSHELLELLLFYAIPRQNTNPLAHRLIAEFGSVYNVLSASAKQLATVEGIGERTAAFLSGIGRIIRLVGEQEQSTFPAKFEHETFLPFCKREYGKLPYEVLDIYFLDSENTILRRRRFSTSSTHNVQLKTDELREELAKDNVSGIVVVHNHPSGNPKPSPKDDETTKKCQAVCGVNNVLLCDHIISASTGVFSYYGGGKLKELSYKWAFDILVKD